MYLIFIAVDEFEFIGNDGDEFNDAYFTRPNERIVFK